MRERLNDGMKAALKAGEKRTLATLRLILAAIKDRDINARAAGKERVGDDEILQILAKMIKQREESARIFEEQNRLDLSEREREEMEIIRTYLPEPMAPEEMRKACESAIKELNATSLRDMGACMEILKTRHPGRIDMGAAGKIVKDLLAARE